jgi:hypothetical protein
MKALADFRRDFRTAVSTIGDHLLEEREEAAFGGNLPCVRSPQTHYRNALVHVFDLELNNRAYMIAPDQGRQHVLR